MKERLWDTLIVLYIQCNMIVTEEGRAEICTLPIYANNKGADQRCICAVKTVLLLIML